MIVRQIRKTDLDGLHKLAKKAGTGITTLQDDRALLKKRLEHTLYSFEKTVDSPSGESYLFVMEDENNKLVGICGILSKVGGYEPFYTYVMTTETHKSKDLKVESNLEILQLEKKYDGPTEIGTLYALPSARGNGKLLSYSRFLFMAEYLDRFEPETIAELRGVVTTRGHSPFYEYCMKHFFKIDYMTADYLSMKNKKFIEDLIPKHPIYVDLLPTHVRDVFGKVHKNTEPAKAMLEKQNFSFNGEIDIFEAGPTYSCPTKEIDAIENSLGGTFDCTYLEDRGRAIIAAYDPFRCCVGNAHCRHGNYSLCVDRDSIAKLALTTRDRIRILFL
jgi:arginine N-succinyltransferase